ncbi:MAG: hypothetical protein QF681_16845, partial [Vicinamibacterales bacterium]|nr:hypothetical protein [Vicinamibacterales bacterium]
GGRPPYSFGPFLLLVGVGLAPVLGWGGVFGGGVVGGGARDRIVPVDQSRRLYEAIRGPKELLVIGGADHNDPELGAGDEMMAAVARFLSAL